MIAILIMILIISTCAIAFIGWITLDDIDQNTKRIAELEDEVRVLRKYHHTHTPNGEKYD